MLALGAFGVLTANAAVKPKKLTIACASKSTGGLRYVTKASQCKSGETAVDLSKDFFQTCVKQHGHRHGKDAPKYRRLPAGSTRLVTSLSLCAPDYQPNEKGWTLPAETRQWFCARKSDGRLRWVVRKPRCTKSEFVVYLNGRKKPLGGGTTPGQQNNVPVANADSASTDEDTSRALTVLGNDTDADGNALHIAAVDTTGTKGTAVANSDGTITYDPNHQFDSLKPGETGTDSFKYRANDGTADSNTATVTVTVTGVNDAPVGVADSSTTDEASTKSFSLTGNDTDVDGDALKIGSVDTSGTAGKVTPHSDGTVSYDPNGKFEDLGAGESRQDIFTYKANDGSADSAPTTVVVTVTGINDKPVVTTTATTLGYTENDPPTAVDPGLTVTDVEDDQIHGATATISAGHANPEDTLGFTPQSGITGSYNPATGVLTLSGNASTAAYQAALRSVTYDNSSNNPSTTTRTISFKVTDVNLADSTAATRDVSVTATEDAPELTTSAGSSAFTENGAAVVIDNALTADDADDTHLESATVSITTGFQSGDELNFTDTANITGTYNSGTGVLALTGHDTKANYQAALRSIEFDTSVDDPPTSKTVTFTANDGDFDSTPVTKSIAIAQVNDAPANTVPGPQGTNEDTPLTITGLAVSDPDAAGATIKTTVKVDHGKLDLSTTAGVTVSGDGTGMVDVEGSHGAITAALANLTYTPASDYPGPSDTLHVDTTDNGNTGTGGAQTDSDTVAIAVNAQNDGPVNHVPGDQSLDEDGSFTFDGANAISVSDVDSDPDSVKVDLSVDHGTLTLGTTGGVTATGDGTGHVTVEGTQSAVNSSLDGLTYAPAHDYGSTDTLTIKTDDLGHNGAGGAIDATNTVGLTVSPVNDAPVLNASGGLTYNENDPATAIAPALTASDVDSANFDSATVTISGNYNSGEDVLAFAGSANITGSWDSTAGTLTLTGPASVNEFKSALESVTYENTSDDPSSAQRTVTFQVDDGSAVNNLSNEPTRTIDVTPSNDRPVVTPSAGTTPYTEGNTTGVLVDPALTVDDPDDANFETGEVSIDASSREPGDELLYTDQNGINGVYNSGVLTLSTAAGASKADWQSALRSIKFRGTSDNPPALKAINFKVNDGDADSSAAAKIIAITPVDDAPVVDTSTGSASYTEGDAGAVVDPNITVDDVDDTHLESAAVQITGNYDSNTDELVFTDQSGISGSWSAGTLTLTGHATEADWQTALRSIQFRANGDNPSGATRTVTFTVNDGDLPSNTDSRDVAVTPVNDKPVVTTSAGDTAWTEGTGPKVVDSGVALDDPDNTTLQGATVEIASGGSSADVLTTTGSLPSGITATYNSSSKTLTISGPGTLADYQTILEGVTFDDTSSAPGGTTRLIAFKVSDGTATSDGAAKNVKITEVNSAPNVATSSGSADFIEDSTGPVAVDPGIDVSDADSANLTGATVEITGNYSSDDSLQFTDSASITHTYSNGKLTLTGTDTVAHYESALATVEFNNGSDTPSTAARTVTFQVDDGQSVNNLSTPKTRDITVTATNDKPVVTPSAAGAPTFTENGAAVAVDPGMTASDVDSAMLTKVTVSVTGGFTSGDTLAAAGSAGISPSYDSGTGVLTLSGPASPSDYSTVLQSVTFASTSENPGSAQRTLTYVANDGAGFNNLSSAVTRKVDVTPVNDSPALAQPDGTATYTEDDPTQKHSDAIAPNLTVSDADDANLTSATIQITAGGHSEDKLHFTNQNNITVSGEGTTTLTLSGSDTVAHYRDALRSVSYQNTSDTPSSDTRTVAFQVSDGHTGDNPLSNTVSRDFSVVPTNDAPVAAAEVYDAVGNTTLVVNDGTDPAPSTPDPTDGATGSRPHKTITDSILADSSDVDGPTPRTVVANSSIATTAGGTVNMEADGDFVYDPPASPKPCADYDDTFPYQVKDASGATGTGTITIHVKGCVWYADNDASSSSDIGTAAQPFAKLSDAASAGATGDSIYVYKGDGTSTNYAAGIALKNTQQLIGQAAALVVGGDTLSSADSTLRPTITAVDKDVVDLASGDTVAGIGVEPEGNGGGVAGSTGDAGGTLKDVKIDDNGTPGQQPELELNGTSGTWNLTSLAISNQHATTPPSTETGVRLNNAGTVNFTRTGLTSIGMIRAKAVDINGTDMGSDSVLDNVIVGVGSGNASTVGAISMTSDTGTTEFGAGLPTDLDLTTGSSSTAAFLLHSAGTVKVADTGADGDKIHAGGGPAVDVTGTNANLAFDDVDSTSSTTDGINIDNSAATPVAFSAADGDITAAGFDLDLNGGAGTIAYAGNLNDGTGGTARITGRTGGTVTLSGKIADGTDAGGGVTMSGNSGGSTSFTNASKTLNTGASNAVDISMPDNSTASVDFSGGGLNIDTTTGRGLSATGIASAADGSVVVRGSGNTIDTTSGVALNVSNTAIGDNDLTFQSIASNGAANGIVLANTSNASGKLIVAGNGGTCTTSANCTGGAIQSSTSAGIDLSSVPGGVDLTRMYVGAGGDDGIRAATVAGFAMANSVVTGNGNAAGERGLDMTQLSGTVTLNTDTVSGSYDRNVSVDNTSGSVDMAVTDGTYSSATTNYGIFMRASGSSAQTQKLNIQGTTVGGVTFNGNNGNAIVVQGDNNANANQTVTVNNASVSSTPGAVVGGGITMSPGGTSTMTTTITNNTIVGANVQAITVDGPGTMAAPQPVTIHATITGNTIGNPAVSNSGAFSGNGIGINANGNATIFALVQNNLIRQYANVAGIVLTVNDGSSALLNRLDATIKSNTINTPGTPSARNGLRADVGFASSGEAGTLCLDAGDPSNPALKNNVFAGSPDDTAAGKQDIRITEDADAASNLTVKLPGLSPAPPASLGAIATYLIDRNDAGGTPTAAATGALGDYQAGTCTLP